jgi:lipoyl(octanoyl) transferase
MNPVCEVWRLGRVPYAEAWALQNRLADERSRGGSDRLLLLEHPHTYTLGSSGHDEHLLMPPEERERLGVGVFYVDRGGDITYHGPGQLVGYPILRLERDNLRADFVGYVRRLEQVIIATVADYGVIAKPIKGMTGVWVETPGSQSEHGETKLAAIGVRINVRAVTKHGFALNLNPDLSYFDGIIPCGIHDKGVTSLAALLGAAVDEADVTRRLIGHFGAVFGYDLRERPVDLYPISQNDRA